MYKSENIVSTNITEINIPSIMGNIRWSMINNVGSSYVMSHFSIRALGTVVLQLPIFRSI